MKEEKFKHYNYVYLDPTKPGIFPLKGLNIILKHEPFYAGKGIGKRWKKHLSNPKGRFMKCKLQSLKEKGISPIVSKLTENISNHESCENEKYLIRVIGRRDLGLGTLVNLTDGGEEGYKMSTESKLKMRLAKLGKPGNNLGYKYSEEAKLKMFYDRKGEKAYMFGKKHSESTRLKISLKQKKLPILQYSKDNILIKEHTSANEAAVELKIHNSNIVKCLKGRIKSYKGFKWKYKN